MRQLVRKAAEAAWVLTLLVLLGGVGVWLYQNPLQDVETARRFRSRLLELAVTPSVLGCVGLCFALGVAGSFTESRVRRSRQSFSQRPALSPLAVVDAE